MSTSWGNGPVQVRLTIGQTTLTQADIRSFCHRAACCDGDIGLGQVCAATLTATLTGARDLLNETITAELGAGDPLVWHELGTFVVTQCQRGEDSTTVSACDAAWYALSAVYAPTVDSGADVYDVLEDLADQCGLDVEQTTLNLGLGISVTGTLTGHTCRAMLGYLAALCGRNCVISRAGEIRFVWFESTEESIDPDRTYAGTYQQGGTSTLLGLKCTVPDGDSESTISAGNAEKAVEVVCPLMTQTRLNALWSALGGYQWPVLEVSCYGGAEVLPGDVVTVEDTAGNSLSLPVMEVSLSVDGGCRCTLRSFGKGDTARGADSIGPRELRLQRVEQTAGVAMQSANGKNKVFHQASAPAASEGLTAGDIWFDTANGNRISTWTGTAWSSFTLQNAAISNLDAGAITTGKLDAAHINVTDLFAQDISATGSITGAQLAAGDQQSGQYYFSVGRTGAMQAKNALFENANLDGYLIFRAESSARFKVQTEQDDTLVMDYTFYRSGGPVSVLLSSVSYANNNVQWNLIGDLDVTGSLITLKGKIAEGTSTTASGSNSHAEGTSTTASGSNSHAEGYNTTASGSNSHAEGYNTTASGPNSHAEGGGTTAEGDKAHAEGNTTTASGNHSHAEGHGSIASGPNSHAEGGTTTASNWDAHAEGSRTVASGDKSHAEGLATVASGARSHAGGYYTIANGTNQTAIGAYNIADTSSLFIVGNGTADSSRSNAMTVDGSGNVNISGQFKRHGNNFIVVEQKSFNASCSANSYSNQIGSVEKSGYTPIGVVGYDVTGSNSSHICVYRLIIDGNLIRWNLRNYGSSNYSSTITVRILYMAN